MRTFLACHLVLGLIVFSVTAQAVRYVPTWSVYHEKNGEGYNHRIGDEEFAIPKTDCVVQKPNRGEGDNGHFVRHVVCRNGERHTVDCTATTGNQNKKCHALADKFSLNLSVKVYPHLGNKHDPARTLIKSSSIEEKGTRASDNNGTFRYHPVWTVSYPDQYGNIVSEKLEWQLTYKIPGTDCTLGEPNEELGTEVPKFIREITCKSGARHRMVCDAYGFIVLESQPAAENRAARDLETKRVPRKPLKGRKKICEKNSRIIPITDQQTWNNLVHRCKEQYQSWRFGVYGQNQKDYLLFDGLNKATSMTRLKLAQEMLNLRHKTWHCLRHTRGTMLFGETGDRELAKMWLGHSSDKVFEKYNHTFQESVRKARKPVVKKTGDFESWLVQESIPQKVLSEPRAPRGREDMRGQ